jgi:NAD(P)-dependent dehydrogenase (short-subunit alcohol dehydrogenase family)
MTGLDDHVAVVAGATRGAGRGIARALGEAGKKDPHFLESESPLFVGRAVAALAGDPKIMERSGRITSSWEVAREHGFSDADGRRPDWGRHMQEQVTPNLKWLREGFERQLAGLNLYAGRIRGYLGQALVADTVD